MIMPQFCKPLYLFIFCALAAGCAGSGALEPAGTDAREAVVNTVIAQLGAPYRYDGSERTGFDASGLVHFSYEQSGYALPREAEGQIRAGQPTRFALARPGDILYFRLDKSSGEAEELHNGIYIGEGQMVHASLKHDEVVNEVIDNPYWFARLVAVIKVLP